MRTTLRHPLSAARPSSFPPLLLAAVLLTSVVVGPARAAAAATASMDSPVAFRGQSKTINFTLASTGGDSIGSVQIDRPSVHWTITGCSNSVGWTNVQGAASCGGNSLPGTEDNLSTSGVFSVTATAPSNGNNDTGSAAWAVSVDASDTYGGAPVPASVDPAGTLSTYVHSIEITDAVIEPSGTAVGAACPPANRSAVAGDLVSVTVCGNNFGGNAFTADGAGSSLGGAFVGTAGTFVSGSIGAGLTGRVLARYDGTSVTSGAEAGLGVDVSLGAPVGPKTSPPTTFGGYEATSDGMPPDAPTVSSTDPVSPSGNRNPLVIGSAPGPASVSIYTDDTCAGPVAGSGDSSEFASPGIVAAAAANAVTTFYATAEDSDGVSDCSSSSVSYTHDDIVPDKPVITGFDPGSPSAVNMNPDVEGTAEPDSTVTLHKSDDCSDTAVGTTKADGSGDWSRSGGGVDADATTDFSATATDAAGNVSDCSDPASYTHDNLAPDAPVITALVPASPSSSNTNPTLEGTAEPSTTIYLYTSSICGGSAVGASPVDGSGNWSMSSGGVVPDTTTAFSARTRDGAGNFSACSNSVSYTHDNIPPSAPLITATDPSSPTRFANLTVFGTAEYPGEVRLFQTDDCSGPFSTVSVNPGGTWAVPTTVPANATASFTATAIDPAGNESDCSAPFEVSHDNIPPSPPHIITSNPVSPANNTRPKLTGTAEVGSYVMLFEDPTCFGLFVTGGPAWRFSDAGLTVIVPGNSSTTFYALAIDQAGNRSPCSTGFNYIEDSTIPVAPVITSSDPASPATENNPRIVGIGSEADAVALFTSQDCSGTPVATGPSSVFEEAGFNVRVPDGETRFHAAYWQGLAISPCSDGFTYVKDSTAPQVIGWDANHEVISPNGDGKFDELLAEVLFNEEVDWTFDVTGGTSPMASAELPAASVESGSGSTLSATWDAEGLPDGHYKWVVNAADKAGNPLEEPLEVAVEVDTRAPVVSRVRVSPRPFRGPKSRPSKVSLDVDEASGVKVRIRAAGRVLKNYKVKNLAAPGSLELKWWPRYRRAAIRKAGGFNVVVITTDKVANQRRTRIRFNCLGSECRRR